MTIDEAKFLFNQAIEESKDENVKAFLKDFVADNSIQDYFFVVPSSSSGKYHPEDELESGGLVLHTLKCLVVANTMSRMWQLTEYETALAKAALLLHDSCKNGIHEDGGHTEFRHPVLAAENIVTHAASLYKKQDIRYKIANKVAKLISSHMGQWNTSKYEPSVALPLPKTKLEKFVHECDYIASRKEFIIKAV